MKTPALKPHLKEPGRAEVRRLYLEFKSQREIAALMQISQSTVSRIVDTRNLEGFYK